MGCSKYISFTYVNVIVINDYLEFYLLYNYWKGDISAIFLMYIIFPVKFIELKYAY